MKNNNRGESAVLALLVLVAVLLAFASIGVAFYGLYLAFSASIILGLIVLCVEPSPFILGAVMLFFNKDLAQMLVDWLSK